MPIRASSRTSGADRIPDAPAAPPATNASAAGTGSPIASKKTIRKMMLYPCRAISDRNVLICSDPNKSAIVATWFRAAETKLQFNCFGACHDAIRLRIIQVAHSCRRPSRRNECGICIRCRPHVDFSGGIKSLPGVSVGRILRP